MGLELISKMIVGANKLASGMKKVAGAASGVGRGIYNFENAKNRKTHFKPKDTGMPKI